MKNKNYSVAKTSADLRQLLDLSDSDMALIQYKIKLSKLTVKAMKDSGLAVSKISKISGVARSKVSAIKNGSSVGVTCDLLIKIIAATGLEMATPKAA